MKYLESSSVVPLTTSTKTSTWWIFSNSLTIPIMIWKLDSDESHKPGVSINITWYPSWPLQFSFLQDVLLVHDFWLALTWKPRLSSCFFPDKTLQSVDFPTPVWPMTIIVFFFFGLLWKLNINLHYYFICFSSLVLFDLYKRSEFIQIVKRLSNFLKQNSFLTCYWSFLQIE